MIAPTKHHIAGSGPIAFSCYSSLYGDVRAEQHQFSSLTVPHRSVSVKARLGFLVCAFACACACVCACVCVPVIPGECVSFFSLSLGIFLKAFQRHATGFSKSAVRLYKTFA